MANTHSSMTVGLVLLLAGCHYASDLPPGGAAPVDAGSGAVRIDGLERFHQTAEVVTRWCRDTRFETDRRAAAVTAIRAALEPQAAALPGGLQFDVRSLDMRVRCNMDGFGGLQGYCMADSTLTVVADGKDRRGQSVRVEVSKEVSERVEGNILCINAMPAVSRSVDKALDESLSDLQRRLSSQTGVPVR
jgi:hypothetical protein